MTGEVEPLTARNRRSSGMSERARKTNQNLMLPFSSATNLDKQQEVDVQTFDNQPSGGPSGTSNPTRARSPRTMSQISGFKRPLMHTNSFTSDRLPVYGVETPHEATLGAMLNDINTWGIDIFKIGTLSCNRPLTSVAYQIFQVSQFNSLHFHSRRHLPEIENRFELRAPHRKLSRVQLTDVRLM